MQNTDFLFEISWEVCNKIGGIHTVISSKAQTIMNVVKNYFVIGPYVGENNKEFSKEELPFCFKGVVEVLRKKGIKIHYGKWNVSGSPNVVLVEYLGYSSYINEIKGRLWEDYKIDSLNSSWHDFDEVMLWGWCCGIVVEELSKCIGRESDIFVHAHEWIAGGSIFYIKTLGDSRYKTVFTTHATMLGRALCGNGQNVYEIEDKIDANQKAYEMNIYTKQQAESALANSADAFTTVSRITGKETEYFYNKVPDRLLFNGFDNPDANYEKKIEKSFSDSRKKVDKFLEKYFDEFYDIDLDKALVFYTSGRNEFRNKGVDIYIKSLGKLNEKLRAENSEQVVINLFLIPIGDFEKDSRLDRVDCKRNPLASIAPLSTHFVPQDNEIIRGFVQEGLLNKKDDNVKVVLVPIYIDKNDGIFNDTYYDVIAGLDLGVFASYYEPWGYTPLESINFGVPTITSDLAGFGRTVEKEFGGNKAGVKVLSRESLSDELVVDELFDYLSIFVKKNQQRYSIERLGAHVFSKNFSWKIFIKNYIKAYEIARNKNLRN